VRAYLVLEREHAGVIESAWLEPTRSIPDIERLGDLGVNRRTQLADRFAGGISARCGKCGLESSVCFRLPRPQGHPQLKLLRGGYSQL